MEGGWGGWRLPEPIARAGMVIRAFTAACDECVIAAVVLLQIWACGTCQCARWGRKQLCSGLQQLM